MKLCGVSTLCIGRLSQNLRMLYETAPLADARQRALQRAIGYRLTLVARWRELRSTWCPMTGQTHRPLVPPLPTTSHPTGKGHLKSTKLIFEHICQMTVLSRFGNNVSMY